MEISGQNYDISFFDLYFVLFEPKEGNENAYHNFTGNINREVMMIRVENLCVSFHKMEVLHQVSAEFDDGQITGIMGRNGSGKTVLLKAICGMCVPESGRIRINDQFLTPENVHRFSMVSTQ